MSAMIVGETVQRERFAAQIQEPSHRCCADISPAARCKDSRSRARKSPEPISLANVVETHFSVRS